MTNCQDVYGFLTAVSNRSVTSSLPEPDLSTLEQLMLVQRVTADQYAQMSQEVAALASDKSAIDQEAANRAQLANAAAEDERRTHSILFHFENKDKQATEEARAGEETGALRSTDADLAQRIQAFNALLAKRSTLDTLVQYPGGYIGLTSAGLLQLRQLGIRLYRVSDLPFQSYWAESVQVDRDLGNLADLGSRYVAGISTALTSADFGYLWAIGIGLAKSEPDPQQGGPRFLDAYARLGPISHNDENRLMSAEILCSARGDPVANLPALAALEEQARRAGVPKESSLGVASVLLLGQRADGTYATDALGPYLELTRSFESAALLAIVNRPIPDMTQKFQALRAMFASWGFAPSEDTELASAYLTVSDLPAESVNTKVAIISKGLGAYLQYPLVAAAILAAIPVLEANETLNLLEEAYGIVGRRAATLTPPELICLAVRMVHGVRPQTIQNLDTTATPAAAPSGALYGGPRFFFVPILVAHGAYYSTFSGVGGVHPGHAHFGTGGFTG